MFLTKLKGTAAGLMVACAVVVTGVAGWDTAVARPQEPAAAGRRAPNPDKERIAQLEKERAELLKKLADLQARLDALEGQKLPLRVGGERVVLTGELPVIGEKLVVREGVRLVDKAAPADERVPALHVYPVADLTAGDPDGQSIIRLITATVAPDSWRAAGGPGVVEYFAPTKSLVVRHTADAHKQLAELLKLLRVKPVGE